MPIYMKCDDQNDFLLHTNKFESLVNCKRLGIDIGGTNIAVGVVDENFNIISKVTCKTQKSNSEEELCNAIIEVSNQAMRDVNVSIDEIPFIGIGCPGTVNVEDGIIEYSSNMFIKNWNISEVLAAKMSKPVLIENDANAAAIGEYIAGAARGYKNAIVITIGTGIGSGIIIDGKLYSGSNFAGAEIGHMVIDFNGRECNCSRKGCWETYSSATGLAKTTKEYMLKNSADQTIMWSLVEGDIEKVGGRTAFQAMRLGDRVGKKVVDEYINYFGCGLTNVINIFQPDVVCIGGGVSHEGDALIEPLKKYIKRERYSKYSLNQTEICAAQLGNDAGIIGAAVLDKFYPIKSF